MSIVPNTLWSWRWQSPVNLGSMLVPLAIKALVQNQVDLILQECHLRDWVNWTHEDLRKASLSSRHARKQALLGGCSGMLSGLGAVSLNDDAWTPVYILSVTIPRAQLVETSHPSDFRILDVVWEHKPSAALSVTFYNNHLPSESSFRHFVTHNLSTKRRSEWTLGRKGSGFPRAAQVLMNELYRRPSVPENHPARSVALRVGESVGEFGWSEPKDGQRELMLRQYELRPLSLTEVQSVPGTISTHSLTTSDGRSQAADDTDFAFPFDKDAPRTVREFSKEKRVAAIYRERFVLRMSEKTISDVRATESAHERPLVQTDEVLVTINGLESSYTPELLFSAVWDIFPPHQSWSVPLPGRNLPAFVFYKPAAIDAARDAPRPCFFLRGYLVPSGPPLHTLGVNYSSDLDLVDDQTVATTGARFGAYLLHLAIALDTAFCTMPELAVELAVDILTDSKAPSYSFGRVLSPSRSMEEDGRLAYRAAFEAAWRRLDTSLADPDPVLYPYATENASEDEKGLIEGLGMRPIPVQPHVKQILEKAGAYPPIKMYAEALLLSSPGTLQQPHGTENLRAALTMLFPAAQGDLLSLRRYDYPQPRIVWDTKAEIFVMSASVACEEHQVGDAGGEPCLCWVGVVLMEAVASWRSKKGAPGGQVISDSTVFRALLQCTQPAHSGQRASSTSSASSAPSEVRVAEQWDDGELEYNDLPTPKTQAALAYPSPQSPSVQHRRRTRAVRSPAFVITPLPSKRQRSGGAPSPSPSLSHSPPVTGNPGATDPFTEAAGSPPEGTSGAPDGLADFSDIVADMHRRLDGRVRAIQEHHTRTRTALQDQLAQAHTTATSLRATLETERAEHAAVVAAKEAALAARELALEDKDALLRAWDVTVRRLREALRERARRARAVEAEAARERRDNGRLRAKAEAIRRQLMDMARAPSEREGSVVEVDGILGGGGGDGGGDGKEEVEEVEEVEGWGEPPVLKRMRVR